MAIEIDRNIMEHLLASVGRMLENTVLAFLEIELYSTRCSQQELIFPCAFDELCDWDPITNLDDRR